MMTTLLLMAVLAADEVVWHQEVAGKTRVGLSGGLDDRATGAADRKVMLAGLDPWVAFFEKGIAPKGLDVVINKRAHGGSKTKDGPWYQSVDVMLLKYTSSPRWGNQVRLEDETGLTFHVNINSVAPLGDTLYRVGETEKGGAMFLAPDSVSRHGFTEYVVSQTDRALVLTAPGQELFVPVSRRDLWGSLKKEYQKKRIDTSKLDEDHAALSPAELDAQAYAAPEIGSRWPGLSPPKGKPVVKYNPKFFKTRTQRTAPHFAMVHWKCSRLQPQDFGWMESLVERLDWQALAKLLAP
ncbi:MAG: hypothetical protein JNK82_36615 [Myxococcaceae bacterium]|nr:hypothetical protein [Myxococcaceae bacterium]